MNYDIFDADAIKVAISIAIRKQKFPGVSEQWLHDALEWVNSIDGRQFLLAARDSWERYEPEPKPEQEDNPDPYAGMKSMTAKQGGEVSVNKVLQKKYVFPLMGKDLKRVIVTFSDGQPSFVVRDPSRPHIPFSRRWAKYRPGVGSREEPTMEIYAERGTRPESCTIYYE